MSCYPVCPTCGRLLADKEYYFKTQKEIIENKDLTQEEYKKEFDKLWNDLRIPIENMCCRMRLLTYVPLEDIIK